MSKTPLVSVVIPVYNGADFLGAAIDSVLGQTYSNIEILVVNDGSTDGGMTREVANSYEGRIRYFEKENGGISTALNLGIKEMKGDYFSWLSHDDLFTSTKIEKQILFLEEKTEISLIYADYLFIDKNGNQLPERKDIYSKAGKNFIFQLLTYFPINGITTLIHKNILVDVGFFNEELRTSQDYDYWFRCSKKYPVIFLNEVVAYSRIHANQGTRTILTMKFESDELYTRIVRYFFTTPYSLSLTNKEITECVSFLLKNNLYSAALMFIRCLESKILKNLLYLNFIIFPLRNLVRDLYRNFF
jgi:glycosyltransferase involved in cell wall biosynthesis